MHMFQFPIRLSVVISCALFLATACAKDNTANAYLIRVREHQVTLSDFQQAVESAREEAFPEERNIDPEMLNQLRVQVLNQLTEELIIIERGAELGISVSEAELDKALAAIKADYPDNTFDETLLENAISLEAWKQKLARRLVVEKVIAKELIDNVKLTTEEMAEYYQEANKKSASRNIDSDEQNEKIVLQLRRIKAEAAYRQWIEDLRSRYQVEINQAQWEKLIGRSS